MEPLFDSVGEMARAVSALELELPHDVWVDLDDKWTRLHVEIAERWGDVE